MFLFSLPYATHFLGMSTQLEFMPDSAIGRSFFHFIWDPAVLQTFPGETAHKHIYSPQKEIPQQTKGMIAPVSNLGSKWVFYPGY